MLLPLACLKRYFLKDLQSLSEFLQHYQSLKVGLSLMKVFLRVTSIQIQQFLGTSKLTKSLKSELTHLFQCCILIPRKCSCKAPFQQTVPPSFKLIIKHIFVNFQALQNRGIVSLQNTVICWKSLPRKYTLKHLHYAQISCAIKHALFHPKFWKNITYLTTNQCKKLVKSSQFFPMLTTVGSTMALIQLKLSILPAHVGLNMARDIDPVIVTNPGTYILSSLFWTYPILQVYYELKEKSQAE